MFIRLMTTIYHRYMIKRNKFSIVKTKKIKQNYKFKFSFFICLVKLNKFVILPRKRLLIKTRGIPHLTSAKEFIPVIFV